MADHLSSRRVNIAELHEQYRAHVFAFLDKCVGTKSTVWDEDLMDPMCLITDAKAFKDRGVVKFHKLTAGNWSFTTEHIIYIVRPLERLMGYVAELTKNSISQGKGLKYSIMFVPSTSEVCNMKLKDLGILDIFKVREAVPVYLFPLEHDLISMERPETFKECYLEGDTTLMHHVVNAILQLQEKFGAIATVYGKGDLARQVSTMLSNKQRELGYRIPQTTPQIDQLVLIDRSVDLVTPLLTQLTYEGLIDEFFSIKSNTVWLPKDKSAASSSSLAMPDREKLYLTSADKLYMTIRDANFSALGLHLTMQAQKISQDIGKRDKMNSVQEIKAFVDTLPHIQAEKSALARHMNLAELIKPKTDADDFRTLISIQQEFFNEVNTNKKNPHIERCLALQDDILKVCRLMCLQSVVNGGLDPKLLTHYQRELLHGYGFQHMESLLNLEKVGLLKASGPTRVYPAVRRALKVVVDGVDEQNPKDVAYVYSGYAPISVRLINHLTQNGSWRTIGELMKILPGDSFEETQPIALIKKGYGGKTQKMTLVFFLGGCTFTEVAALRFLAQQESAPSDFVVATTGIINGNSLIRSLIGDQ